jgi:ABC-type multidrug transport system ATPase subunit
VNIELTSVTRSFGASKAVDGVSLQAGPGVLGLLGPNGAGKTSLLRMLATVLPPSSGGIRLLDRDPGSAAQRREIRRRLGYLPQQLGYYPAFTVTEFVEYFALLKEVPPGSVSKAVAAAVDRVDLGPKAKARLRTLSGGMLRRVGIAQAIVNGPELLFLDEPTAGLDPEQRVGFRALLRDLGQTATVVVSTHLVEDVDAACSEVALMDAGRIVFRGTPADLTAQGTDLAVGDAPLERGYSAVLQAARGASRGNVSTSGSAADNGEVPA